MLIAILSDPAANQGGPDLLDVLAQSDFVEQTLTLLGHRSVRVPATLDLERLQRDLAAARPDVVFNLVESLAGQERLLGLPAELMETAGIRFTGCSAAALNLTTNKRLAKRWLRAHGLATPAWVPGDDEAVATLFKHAAHRRFILKSNWQHGSAGLTSASVVTVRSPDELRDVATPELFAEQFIDGREFNLSILESDGQPRVLPVAEIEFTDWPADQPRIVDYAAKWDERSPQAQQTPRRFHDRATLGPLHSRLIELAVDCWRIFELRGYARVDVRVDEAGQPWILEVNANPCIAPDAGFMAATRLARLSPGEVIAAILAAC